MKFIDTDERIEAEQEKSIPDLFAEYGEPYFRDLRRRGLYNMLSRADRFATNYTVSLINTYYDAGGDINALGESLDRLGIDISSVLENAKASSGTQAEAAK